MFLYSGGSNDYETGIRKDLFRGSHPAIHVYELIHRNGFKVILVSVIYCRMPGEGRERCFFPRERLPPGAPNGGCPGTLFGAPH